MCDSKVMIVIPEVISTHRELRRKYILAISNALSLFRLLLIPVSARCLTRNRNGRKPPVVSNPDFEIIISLFTYYIVGVIFKWLESNMKIAPEAVTRCLAFLAEGQARSMLERASGKPT